MPEKKKRSPICGNPSLRPRAELCRRHLDKQESQTIPNTSYVHFNSCHAIQTVVDSNSETPLALVLPLELNNQQFTNIMDILLNRGQ